jgi:hypothetical protein
MKKVHWFILVLVLIASSFGVKKALAQVTEVQPFTAMETHITRSVELKEPIMYTRLLAVSADRYAQIQQSQLAPETVNTRTVVDRKARTKISIDPAAKLRFTHKFTEDRSLVAVAGGTCEGTPEGQIEGFDVNFKQLADMKSGLETIATQQWAAPKLGCYVLRQESHWTDADGKFVRSIVRTLSAIQVGEPDPSYFDTSLPEGYTDGTPQDYEGAIVNHKRAQQQKQQ